MQVWLWGIGCLLAATTVVSAGQLQTRFIGGGPGGGLGLTGIGLLAGALGIGGGLLLAKELDKKRGKYGGGYGGGGYGGYGGGGYGGQQSYGSSYTHTPGQGYNGLGYAPGYGNTLLPGYGGSYSQSSSYGPGYVSGYGYNQHGCHGYGCGGSYSYGRKRREVTTRTLPRKAGANILAMITKR